MNLQKRFIASAVLALSLGAGAVPSASASENRAVVEHFSDQVSALDEFLTDVCGTPIQFSADVNGTFRLAPNNGDIHVTEQGTVVFENLETGKTLTNWWRLNYRGKNIEPVEEEGLVVFAFDDTFSGMPERWIDSDGRTLIKDTGNASVVGRAVVDPGDPEDPFDDVLVSLDEVVTSHGPHPILEGDLDAEFLCNQLS